MKRQLTRQRILIIQVLFFGSFAVGWALLPDHSKRMIVADVVKTPVANSVRMTNKEPAVIVPLQKDAEQVSDEELLSVLKAVAPRFDRVKLRPNYVEHALRIWGSRIEFEDEALISGPEMVDFLLDSSRYVNSWGPDCQPILLDKEIGVDIRWGQDRTASVHHDHLLACLAEAGVSLDRSVMTTARRTNMEAILTESLRDFRLNERETEWSLMAFGLYLAPQKTTSWNTANGRSIDFDRLTRRLILGTRNRGVCLGTHRVYSLAALLQLDGKYGPLLSEDSRQQIYDFLNETRELIVASQEDDGSWPPNWHDGAAHRTLADPDEKAYRRVIATGHHLEWLAIAPDEFQLPIEDTRRAAQWIVKNVQKNPQSEIDSNYTYYSHAANSLALWRGLSTPEAWTQLQAKNAE